MWYLTFIIVIYVGRQPLACIVFFPPGDSQLNHGSVIGLICKGEVSVAATHANAHMSLNPKDAMGESLGEERGPVMYTVVVLL